MGTSGSLHPLQSSVQKWRGFWATAASGWLIALRLSCCMTHATWLMLPYIMSVTFEYGLFSTGLIDCPPKLIHIKNGYNGRFGAARFVGYIGILAILKVSNVFQFETYLPRIAHFGTHKSVDDFLPIASPKWITNSTGTMHFFKVWLRRYAWPLYMYRLLFQHDPVLFILRSFVIHYNSLSYVNLILRWWVWWICSNISSHYWWSLQCITEFCTPHLNQGIWFMGT